MATNLLCDPCGEEHKSREAIKYCSDCEEKFCVECADSHLRFKASKTHPLVDLSTTNSIIPSPSNTECQSHPNFQLDLFCCEHNSMCCGACIPDSHRGCRNVLPLAEASKNVNNSNSLSGAFEELTRLSNLLSRLHKNRDENKSFIENKKSSIVREINCIKTRLLQRIDHLEKQTLCELDSVYQRNLTKINEDTDKILSCSSTVDYRKQMLQFARDHCSNKQLFMVLHRASKENSETDRMIQGMLSNIKEIDILFKKSKHLNLNSFGFIREQTYTLNIQKRLLQPSNVGTHVGRLPNHFKNEGSVKLKPSISYQISGIAVTKDNKLLLCNFHSDFPNMFIYKDCEAYESVITFSSPPYGVAVIPMTDKGVVTLPVEQSIQIICTTKYTNRDKIQIGEACYGVTATNEIFIGAEGTVHILDLDGRFLRRIKTNNLRMNNMFFNDQNNQILLRCPYTLCCLSMEGKVIYQFNVSGNEGLAVDQNLNVYTSGYYSNDIRRFPLDGKWREIVMDKENDIVKPCNIAFNSDFSKLFIVNNHKSISVYSCN